MSLNSSSAVLFTHKSWNTRDHITHSYEFKGQALHAINQEITLIHRPNLFRLLTRISFCSSSTSNTRTLEMDRILSHSLFRAMLEVSFTVFSKRLNTVAVHYGI